MTKQQHTHAISVCECSRKWVFKRPGFITERVSPIWWQNYMFAVSIARSSPTCKFVLARGVKPMCRYVFRTMRLLYLTTVTITQLTIMWKSRSTRDVWWNLPHATHIVILAPNTEWRIVSLERQFALITSQQKHSKLTVITSSHIWSQF